MSIGSKLFIQKMLLFLPSTVPAYEESVHRYGEALETIMIEDIFMPKITELLKTKQDPELLTEIFHYFEQISASDDHDLVDHIFSVTVLELLGTDPCLLEASKEYIGPQTMQLLQKAVASL